MFLYDKDSGGRTPASERWINLDHIVKAIRVGDGNTVMLHLTDGQRVEVQAASFEAAMSDHMARRPEPTMSDLRWSGDFELERERETAAELGIDIDNVTGFVLSPGHSAVTLRFKDGSSRVITPQQTWAARDRIEARKARKAR
jgi:hypothetical protein